MKVTDHYLKSLQPADKRCTVSVGDSLFLRITPNNARSWVMRYSSGGRVKDLTLGHFPDLSLKQARQAAHLKRQELNLKPSAGMCLKDAYVLWKKQKRGHLVNFTEECSRIEHYLMPTLGKIKLEELSAPLTLNALKPLEAHVPTQRRCLMCLNEMLELAICAGLMVHNPCRKLSRFVGKHTPQNRRYIPAERLGELFALLAGEPLWFHCFVLWSVYSLLRPTEAVSIKWSWLDGNTLTCPASVMKKRLPHRIPLCPEVLGLLKLVKTLRKHRSGSVWCMGRSGGTINNQYFACWLRRSALSGKLTPHGLRATGRTWFKDEGVPFEVAEDALAHVTGSQTERAYLRGDYLERRRDIMQRWWDHLFAAYVSCCADTAPGQAIIKALSGVREGKAEPPAGE